MKVFIDRQEELQTLEQEYARTSSSFVVLYGRRRVGKTTTIERFIAGKRSIYFLASEESEAINRASFKDLVALALNNSLLREATIERWESIFDVVAQESAKEKTVLVLDEFQYLGKANAAFPSVLQRIWDTSLKKSKVMLVLCGSLIRMMYSQTLSYNSPLYGRRTAQIKMQQISFRYYSGFYTGATARQLVERYSITGGVPKYVEQFGTSRNIFNDIEQYVLNRSSFLYSEPHFLLSQEVGEVGTYYSIMRAIAAGNHKPSNIAAVLEIKQTNLSKYMAVLSDLDLVKREVPVTEANPEKSKRGRYYLADNFMRFWFRFVLPYASYLEAGHMDVARQKLHANFIDGHVAFVYEDICRERAWELSHDGRIPFTLSRVGGWWDDKHAEIDVVGIGEGNILLGECKYWKNLVGKNVLEELEAKATFINADGLEPFYVLFSISGFTKELWQVAKERNDVLLVDDSRNQAG